MPNLSIEITPVEKVTMKIEGIAIGEFEVVSKWEGMVKLQNKDGSIIVHDSRNFADKLFQEILSGDKSFKTEIVSVTPSLIPDIWRKS